MNFEAVFAKKSMRAIFSLFVWFANNWHKKSLAILLYISWNVTSYSINIAAKMCHDIWKRLKPKQENSREHYPCIQSGKKCTASIPSNVCAFVLLPSHVTFPKRSNPSRKSFDPTFDDRLISLMALSRTGRPSFTACLPVKNKMCFVLWLWTHAFQTLGSALGIVR